VDSEPVILVPSVQKTNGTGHLHRCLHWALAWGWALYIPREENQKSYGLDHWKASFPALLEGVKLVHKPTKGRLIIFDLRQSSPEEYQLWSPLGPVMLLDDSGQNQEQASLVVNTIPPFNRPSNGNYLSWVLAKPQDPQERVGGLVVFLGGEDHKGLSRKLFNKMINWPEREEKVTWISQKLSHNPPELLPGRWRIVPYWEGLDSQISTFDRAILSYGLTMVNALFQGVTVLGFNPTDYHDTLCRKQAIPTMGTRIPRYNRYQKLWRTNTELPASWKDALQDRKSLNQLQGEVQIIMPHCPNCYSSKGRVIARFTHKNYRRCPSCGFLYMEKLTGPEMVYSKDYFFSQYKEQYGKTYLDDFSHIFSMGLNRIQVIEGFWPPLENQKVLDIGCAYGPFLKALQTKGYTPQGLDISQEAAQFVRQELNIPAEAADFLQWDKAPSLQGITMWYVIEHFPDLQRVLKKVQSLLPVGGFFAFSTPSGEGISRRRNLQEFLRQSPDDHFTLWEPSRTPSLLKEYGFQVRKIRVTGHHPERFPQGIPFKKSLSRLFKLGDTFEVYAERIK